MRFLLVAHRELLAAAHRRSTYRVRWTAALLAAGGAALCFLSVSSFANPSRLGIALFSVVGSGCLLLAALAGLFLTADSVASERRDGTLGLLYLTQLGPFDILLGKLIAHGANAACAVLAVFPIFSLSWILGGFTGAEVIRYLFAGLNLLFVSLVVGLAVSSWSTKQGTAVASVAAILGMLAFWPLIALVPIPAGQWIAELSPLTNIGQAPALAYQPGRYWRALALGNLAGWVFLGVAVIGLRRSWRTSAAVIKTNATRRPRRKLLINSSSDSLTQRAIGALLADNSRLRRTVWTGVLLPVILFIFADAIDPKAAVPTYLVTAFVLGLILKGIFAWEAVAPVAEARHSGALEVLLTTAATDRDFRQAHNNYLAESFYAPMITLYAIDWVVIAVSKVSGSSDGGLIIFANLGGVVLTTFQVRAMALGGLWWGIREERATIAFAKNFLLGTVLPIPFMWFCCSGFAVPLILMAWLNAKLRLPLRILLTEGSLPSGRD